MQSVPIARFAAIVTALALSTACGPDEEALYEGDLATAAPQGLAAMDDEGFRAAPPTELATADISRIRFRAALSPVAAQRALRERGCSERVSSTLARGDAPVMTAGGEALAWRVDGEVRVVALDRGAPEGAPRTLGHSDGPPDLARGHDTLGVVWSDGRVRFAATELDGRPLGEPVDLGEGDRPRVAAAPDGYGVIYRRGLDLFFQSVGDEGQRRGAAIHLDELVVAHRPTLVATDDGFLATWSGHCEDCDFRHHVALNLAHLDHDGAPRDAFRVIDSAFVVAGAAVRPTEQGLGLAWYRVNRGHVGNVMFDSLDPAGEARFEFPREIAVTIDTSEPAPALLDAGSDFVVAWAQREDDRRLHLRVGDAERRRLLDLGTAHERAGAPSLVEVDEKFLVAWTGVGRDDEPVVRLAELPRGCLVD